MTRLLLVLCWFAGQAASAASQSAPEGKDLKLAEPVAKGQRVFTTGHSLFHGTPPVLDELAGAAGMTDHRLVGMSDVNGSKVQTHFSGREVRAALSAGTVDVLTMAPIYLPDPGIEQFAELGVKHNPDLRLTVMEIWVTYDSYEPRYYMNGPKGSPTERIEKPKMVDRDAATGESLRKLHKPHFDGMDELVTAVNKKLGKQAVFVVPVGQAVIALREKIIAGQAPGLKSQQSPFSDKGGHPAPALTVLVAYCHHAVIYRKSPVGLPAPKALKIPGGDAKDLEALNRLLQELAWEAVTRHPLSGVRLNDR